MPLPPIVSNLTSGVVETDIAGGTVTVGSVDQGDPNAGGADAWPVVDDNNEPSTVLYDLAPTTAQVGGTALPSQACSWVIVTADPDNTEDMFIGNGTNQRTQLIAGQGLTLPVSNANLVSVRSAGGTAIANALAGN